MIKSFRDRRAEALFLGTGCDRHCRSFERVARRKLLMVHAASSLHDLKAPPSNKLEKLKRIEKVSTRSGLMTSTGFAFAGPTDMPTMSK